MYIQYSSPAQEGFRELSRTRKNEAVLFAVLLTLAMISQLRKHGKRQSPRKKEIMSDEGGRGQADFLEREIGKAACTL
jgi:hypothetical protein